MSGDVYVPCSVILESPLSIVEAHSILLGLRILEGDLSFRMKKKKSSSILVIHYHRMGYIEFKSSVLSLYISISSYIQGDCMLKYTFRLAKGDGLRIAAPFYSYLSSYGNQSSIDSSMDIDIVYVWKNSVNWNPALKRQDEVYQDIWKRKCDKGMLRSETKLDSFLRMTLSDCKAEGNAEESDIKRIQYHSCIQQHSFPTQQQAIEYIAKWKTKERDIKLYSYEQKGSSRRLFLALEEEELRWEYTAGIYNQLNPLQHCYEIIRENCPCKLYMDVEFGYAFNPGLHSYDVLPRLLELISYCLLYHYGIATTVDQFCCLYSENREKFSCHVLLNANGLLFRNNVHLGNFMKWCVQSLYNHHDPRYSVLFVKDKNQQPCFVADMGVYTKNRAMRLLFSSKYSRDNSKSPILPLYDDETTWKFFFNRTLVTEYYFYMTTYRLLYFKYNQRRAGPSAVTRPLKASLPLQNVPFPLPSLQRHLLDAWAVITRSDAAFIRSWCQYTSATGEMKLRLEVGGNRYCLNIQRPHRSNHIYLIVNLHSSHFYQRCHDSACSSFCSMQYPLPVESCQEVIAHFKPQRKWSVSLINTSNR